MPNLKMCILQAVFSKVIMVREELRELSHGELYTRRIWGLCIYDGRYLAVNMAGVSGEFTSVKGSSA